MYTSPTALAYISQVDKTIVFNGNNRDVAHIAQNQVEWDLGSALVVKAVDGSNGAQSAALGLVHE